MSDNQRPGNWQQNPQGPQGPNYQQGNPQPQQQFGPQGQPQPQYNQQQGFSPQGQPQPQYNQQQGFGPQGQQAPVKQKSKTPIIIAAVVAVALLVGGGFLAFSLLGGSTPAAAQGLPSTTLAAIEVNLNPSAGQKLAVKEFAEKFPQLAEEVGDVEGDYKKALWELIPDSEDKPDFDTEIAPWLGDSIAIGVLDIETEAFLVAVQVTDKGAAQAFAEAEFEDTSVEFIDDLMIFSDASTPVDVEAIKDSSLAENETYVADMAKLGADYLATGWASEEFINQAIEASEGEVGIETAGFSAHGAAGIKVEDGNAVLRGISKSSQEIGDAELTDDFVSSLPAGGLGVLGSAFSAESIDLLWEQLAPMYQQDPAMFDAFGISSADDLRAVLGNQLALTFGWEGQQPQVGIKVDTDDPARHQEVLEAIASGIGIPGVQHSTDGNTVYTTWGMSPDALASPSETLGDHEAFGSVTETSGDTQSVLWVDVPAILGNQALGLGNSEEAQYLEPISGIGISGSTLDDGYAEFFVRVGTK
ncbi:hypothetical protein GCM10028820_25560 [Tessaracoccus terricola]